MTADDLSKASRQARIGQPRFQQKNITPKFLPHRLITLLSLVLCLPMGAGAAAQQSAPIDIGAPTGFEMHLFPGATRLRFVKVHLDLLQKYDRNRDGLTTEDISESNAQESASASASRVAYYTRYDVDGDGRVTAAEIEETMKRQLRSHPGATSDTPDFWKHVEQSVARLMEADTNGDKVITYDEMRVDPETRKSKNPYVTMLFDLDPNKDGRITPDEVTKLANEAFDRHDRNGNGILDQDEAMLLQIRMLIAMEKKYDDCTIPKPTPDEQVIVLDVFGGASVASVSVVGPEKMTTTGTLTIEPGQKPIYLFISVPQIAIWQFKGATARISHAVIVTGKAGVVGLQTRQIHFATPLSCPYYSHTAEPGHKQLANRMRIEYIIGRRVDLFAGLVRLANLQVPSLAESEAPNRIFAEPGDVDPRIWAIFAKLHPGGVVELDPGKVIAPDPVERYEVLPGFAGIVQLTRQGVLEVIGERSYRILKPIARFPGDIKRGFAVTFRLAKGVPMPLGSHGDFCVISEETGEILVNTNYCQLN